MGLNYVDLEGVLQPEQRYVAEAAARIGIDVKAVKHDIATDTCYEKRDLLARMDPSGSWTDQRIVKAVFLYSGNNVYGFVFPELGKRPAPLRMDAKKVLPAVLGVSRSAAKSFSNSYCPDGMQYGTCTPFVLASELDGKEMHDHRRVRRIFLHDKPDLDDQVVDISIGGLGADAHKVSLHLPYKGVHDILVYQFGDKVRKASLFQNL